MNGSSLRLTLARLPFRLLDTIFYRFPLKACPPQAWFTRRLYGGFIHHSSCPPLVWRIGGHFSVKFGGPKLPAEGMARSTVTVSYPLFCHTELWAP